MELTEFRLELLANINNSSKANGQYEQQAYLLKITEDLESLGVCQEAGWCQYKKLGKKNKIDEVHGYSSNDDDGTMSIFFCDFSGAEELEKITYADFTNCVKRCLSFIEDAITGYIEDHSDISESGYELSREIRTDLSHINRFDICVVTDKLRSDRFHEIDDIESIFEKKISARLIDIKRYYEEIMHCGSEDDLIVNVPEFGYDGIICLDAGRSDAESCASYIGIVPGRFLAEVYNKYGSRVLESNVRSFLTLRGKINRGIRETIRSKPGMFFAYNNGISVTSKEVSFDETGKKIITFTDFQIVNGGQTTVSLFNELKTSYQSNLDDIRVLMKLSVIESENTADVISNISRYANTQNAVKESDLDSNNEFQKKMEYLSRNTRIPEEKILGTRKWYYERSRGQWDQDRARLKESDRKAFEREYAKERVIDKIAFAKYRFMLEMRPHLVSRGGQTCYSFFSKETSAMWKKDESMFNDCYFKETVASAILYKSIYKQIKDQPWFTGGFRAQIAYYSFSKLIAMMGILGRRINLNKFWELQSVPDEIVDQAMIVCEQIFRYLVSIGNQGKNITQWCKKEDCWKYIQCIPIQPGDSVTNYTIETDDYEKEIEYGIKNQKERDAVDAINNIMIYDAANWYRLRLFASKIGVSIEDIKTLNDVVNYVKSNGHTNISPKTAHKAMQLRKYLVDEGFKN